MAWRLHERDSRQVSVDDIDSEIVGFPPPTHIYDDSKVPL
jgi:hypothetical protein